MIFNLCFFDKDGIDKLFWNKKKVKNMKEKDRLNMVLRVGRFKSFLASILFIFFLIPHILDARTVHRRAYMVCPGGEAYWDANRQQSVCCLG